MSKRGPSPLVAKLSASQGVEGGSVKQPVDALLLPVSGPPVHDDGPGVEAVVGNGNSLSETLGLVAGTAALVAAVDGAVAGEVTVDALKDVELTTEGPLGAPTHGVT